MTRFLGGILALCLLASGPLAAAETTISGNVARFSGAITLDNLEWFEKLPSSVDTLVLNSLGGYGLGLVPTMWKLRAKGITTYVDADGYCASACAILFFGGKSRVLHPRAKLMYHASIAQGVMSDMHDGKGQEWVVKMNKLTAQSLVEYGMDPDFARTTSSLPQKINERILTADQAVIVKAATEVRALSLR